MSQPTNWRRWTRAAARDHSEHSSGGDDRRHADQFVQSISSSLEIELYAELREARRDNSCWRQPSSDERLLVALSCARIEEVVNIKRDVRSRPLVSDSLGNT